MKIFEYSHNPFLAGLFWARFEFKGEMLYLELSPSSAFVAIPLEILPERNTLPTSELDGVINEFGVKVVEEIIALAMEVASIAKTAQPVFYNI